MLFNFRFQEEDRENKSCDNSAASHHLIYRARNEIKGNVLKSRGDKVTQSWYCQKELVHLQFFSLGFCLQLSHFKALRIPPSHD